MYDVQSLCGDGTLHNEVLFGLLRLLRHLSHSLRSRLVLPLYIQEEGLRFLARERFLRRIDWTSVGGNAPIYSAEAGTSTINLWYIVLAQNEEATTH